MKLIKYSLNKSNLNSSSSTLFIYNLHHQGPKLKSKSQTQKNKHKYHFSHVRSQNFVDKNIAIAVHVLSILLLLCFCTIMPTEHVNLHYVWSPISLVLLLYYGICQIHIANVPSVTWIYQMVGPPTKASTAIGTSLSFSPWAVLPSLTLSPSTLASSPDTCPWFFPKVSTKGLRENYLHSLMKSLHHSPVKQPQVRKPQLTLLKA